MGHVFPCPLISTEKVVWNGRKTYQITGTLFCWQFPRRSDHVLRSSTINVLELLMCRQQVYAQ